MVKVVRILLLMSLGWLISAQASLYQVTVPVSDRTQAALQQGMLMAYQQMLIKVSGNAAVNMLPVLKQTPDAVQQLIQSYSYQDGSDNLLNVQFDSSAIRQLLQKAGQPIWREPRPVVLVWIAYNGPDGLALLSNNANPLTQTLKLNASRRGVPLMLPAMDLQDVAAITPQNVWQLDQASVVEASKRYDLKNILVGQVVQNTNNTWQANWLWLSNQPPVHWQTQGLSADQVLAPVIDNVANSLAAQYATPAASKTVPTVVTVKILGINNLDDNSKVERYLRQLPPVTQEEIVSIEPNGIIIKVTVSGGKDSLSQAIAADDQLQLVANNDSQVDLTYQWQAP